MIVDYHMHLRGPRVAGSEPLLHTVAAIEGFVETAARRGVDEIGFTEHVYYFGQTREVWFLPYHLERCAYDLDAYCDAVLEAKRQGLPVKLGLEVDYVGARQDRLGELIAPYPWDFLLGSAHEVGDQAIDEEPGIWAELSVDEVWRGYFAEIQELAQSGHVDVMAHPDLAKIYGLRPAPDVVAELHEATAAAFAAGDVAAEISTAGLGDIGWLFPSGDPQWQGVSSLVFLERAYAEVRTAGYELVNADCVLIGEQPRIAEMREGMRARLAGALGVEVDQIAVRATTTDQLGFTGRGEGLAAQAVALLRSV